MVCEKLLKELAMGGYDSKEYLLSYEWLVEKILKELAKSDYDSKEYSLSQE